jgi:hypothetical protein
MAQHEKGYLINHSAFLEKFEKRNFLEYFVKMGLHNLTNDYVIHGWESAINETGKNVLEILQLPKQQINRLIKLDGDTYTLKLLQTEEKEGERFTDDQMKYMTEYKVDIGSLNVILKYTTIGKIIRYLRENTRYGVANNILRDWVDYIENCRTLKYDLKSEFILFPRHLKQSHDNVANIIMDQRNKSKDKLFKKMVSKMKKDFTHKTKSFAIVVPEKTGDIIKEGQVLHHCVGTYADKVLEGKTTILFIREIKELEKPFYTMEVSQGKVIQVRGLNNKDMTPQVKQFVESFKSKKLQYKPEREAV